MTKETKGWLRVLAVLIGIPLLLSLFSALYEKYSGPSISYYSTTGRTHISHKQSWKDLSMAERKDIYLRVTDFDPGPEADQVTAEMTRKYNISEDDVTAILLKGTFEWGWGDVP